MVVTGEVKLSEKMVQCEEVSRESVSKGNPKGRKQFTGRAGDQVE